MLSSQILHFLLHQLHDWDTLEASSRVHRAKKKFTIGTSLSSDYFLSSTEIREFPNPPVHFKREKKNSTQQFAFDKHNWMLNTCFPKKKMILPPSWKDWRFSGLQFLSYSDLIAHNELLLQVYPYLNKKCTNRKYCRPIWISQHREVHIHWREFEAHGGHMLSCWLFTLLISFAKFKLL